MATLLVVAAPAQAAGQRLTVDPADSNGACTRGTDNVCRTIGQALSAAAGGDTVTIVRGTYAESLSVPADKDGLKIEGAGDVKITGSGTGDVVTIAGDDADLSALTIEVPAGGGSAIRVEGLNAQIRSVVAQRANPTSVNDPVVDVAAGGSGTISRSFVVQNVGENVPAVLSAATAGVVLADSLVLSAAGHGVVVSASTANRILRSTILATLPAADGIRATSTSAGDRALLLESSVLLGGKDGAGLRGITSGPAAGKLSLEARHVTIAAAGPASKAIVLDSSGASQTGPLPPPLAVGHIEAKVFGSIVRGSAEATRHSPALPGITSTANTASLTYRDSDARTPTGNGTWDMGGVTYTESDASLFRPDSFRLRADAPAVDTGGALQPGESATDFEGGAREVDGRDADTTPQSDKGADEWSNVAPKALFVTTDPAPRAGRPLGFISGSTDEGDARGVKEFRWDFGDGAKETTTVGAVAHTYREVGTYNATLTVVDADGTTSDVAKQTITVRDGTPPRLGVTRPVNRAVLRLNPRSGRRGPTKPMTIVGTVVDASGIKSVELNLRLVKRSRVRGRRHVRLPAGTCEHYSGRVLSRKACDKEIWLKPAVARTGWRLRTRRGLRLPPGRWELRVRATDTTGLMTSGFSTADRTLVRFTVK